MSASQVVITSNLPVRADGLPYASSTAADPGIAVWWVRKGKEQVIACDLYRTTRDNMHALDLSLKALGGLQRWGTSSIVEAAFAGFAALPPGSGDQGGPAAPAAPRKKSWREVLAFAGGWPDGLPAEDLLALAKARHRRLIADVHPDRGGDHAVAAALNAALDEAEKELTRG